MTRTQYNECVDLYADGIYRFILKNIRDDEIAKDVVQDTFLKVWEKVVDISYEKAKTYFYTTAYHTMIDRIRKDKRMTRMEDVHLPKSFHSNTYSDVMEVLEEGLKKLPEVQRSVVLLRDYEGYSYKEIGKIVDLTEAQVKVYIYRARLALKKYIVDLDLVI